MQTQHAVGEIICKNNMEKVNACFANADWKMGWSAASLEGEK